MSRATRFGRAALGVIAAAMLSPADAAPGSVQGPTPLASPAVRGFAADDTGARITYPQGHYPRLRLHDGETRLVRSMLNVRRSLAFGDYVWNTEGVPAGPVWVRIDLSRQMLSVFRGGDEIGTAVIIYGANDHPTPVGTFHILEKNPHYYSKAYDAPMPYAQRLTADGVALHASNVRERVATHGCVGLPFEFARLLFGVTNRGDPVEILPDKSLA